MQQLVKDSQYLTSVCSDNQAETPEFPSPADFIATGFHGGCPLRQLLDRVYELHGSLGWSTMLAQRALVAACFDAPMFTYGVQRERRLLRLLFDEVDRCSGTDVAPELTEAAVIRRISNAEEQPFALIRLDRTSLRCSVATSSIGMRLWEAGVALYDALKTPGNLIRSACEGKCVLEIGSGVGLLCTALRAAQVSGAILTELPGPVLSNLDYNVSLNRCNDFIACRPLDVEDTAAVKAASANWPADVVLAADVCYEPSLVKSMVQAFAELIGSSMRRGFMLVTRRSTQVYQVLCQVSALVADAEISTSWTLAFKADTPLITPICPSSLYIFFVFLFFAPVKRHSFNRTRNSITPRIKFATLFTVNML
jgi:predicted nicotinamide N-methyase